MGYANSELKYVKCDFCGQEKKCIVQDGLGVEQAVCADCLYIADCD